MNMKSFKLIFSVVCLVGAVAFACGGDGGGETDTGGVTDTQVQLGTFKAVVKDNLTKAKMEGATVVAIDNDTGELLNEYTTTSDGQGNIEMQVPSGILLGFRITANLFKDTYQFNIDSDAQDEELWGVSLNGYELAVGLAGFEPEDGTAVTAGAIYWVNALGEEEHISCAHIVTDPVGEYRYFAGDTGLPAPLDAVKHTMDGNGEGRFVAGNIPPGKVEITAFFGDDATDADGFIGTATFFAYPDSICITNVYADKSKYPANNPSPATCEE